MVVNQNQIHNPECKCFSWKPVMAGALVAIGLSFLLNLFSVAIGLTAFTTTSEGVETLALGGMIGTAIGVIAAMFVAGWVAGFLGKRHCDRSHLGALLGFLTWCVALIVTIFLATHARDFVSFYSHVISGTGGTFQVVNNTTGNAMTVAVTDTTAKQVVVSAYIVFALFFLSAFACSLGGHCGMRHCCHKEMSV